jgi:3-hydroxy-9,10-secoandrosta-1,3,5(10)-triene-9,17-dione monooxygenase
MTEQSGAGVLEEVRALAPSIAERSAEADTLRRIPDESIKALQSAGLFRLLQPKAFGGTEAHPMDFYRAVAEVGAACGSTGWVASVLGVHPWHIGLFDVKAQQEVWCEDTDVNISSSYAPVGKAKKVKDGFSFSGKWSFSSGCDHCSWVLLGGLVFDEDDKVSDFRTFLLPRKNYTINDVWDTVGLRGTGSNDIVVEDVFVPEYRTLSMNNTAVCECPGQEVNTSPLFRMPYGSIHPFAITAPIIGMARGAYEAHVGATRDRIRASYVGEKSSEDVFAQVRIADAACEIDAAWLQLEHDISTEYSLAEKKEKIPLELRLRARRDQVRGTARAIDAIDRLFESAGGKALGNSLALPRFWRDAHAARVHAANDVERAMVMYGRDQLGLSVRNGMF